MEKILAAVFAALLFTSSHVAAQSTRQDSTCQLDAADVADLGFRFTEASLRYKDLCVDSVRFRPILDLTTTVSTTTFANFQHEGQYWTAQVPTAPELIEKVYFQVLKFPVIQGVVAAHTQIRFVLNDLAPVQLSQTGRATNTSRDILISFEAAFPKDVTYNFALGGLNNYALMAKVMSTLQKHNDSGAAIEQFELLLTPEEKSQLLKNLLTYSHQLGIKDFYNTARPNCTTEVFDQIDQLPRFKGQHRPFLTVLSLDPIAGPSLKALGKRALIREQAQNFSEELTGAYYTKPLPTIADPLSGFLTPIPDMPWALVTVLPDTTTMSESERAAIASLRRELILALPSLIQSYGSVMLLASKEDQGRSLFLNTLKEFAQRLPAALKRVNADLPVNPAYIRIYFAPHDTDEVSANLVSLGVPLELPFAVVDYQMDRDPKGQKATFDRISEGIRAAGRVGVEGAPAFLMSAAIQVRAQKDHSQVTTQLMAGLDPVISPMTTKNDQVAIDQLVIPDTAKDRRQHPGMVLSHVQDVASETINEKVDVQFGPFMTLGGPSSRFGEGSLGITQYFNSCWQHMKYTPVFQGRLNHPWLGFGPVDYMAGIQFHVAGMNLNLKSQRVEKMDLLVSVFSFYCLNIEDVEKQFADNANQAIQDLMDKSAEDPLLRMLGPLFN